ncbi:F-box associated interaction domain, partial [Arabidopsis suecica]
TGQCLSLPKLASRVWVMSYFGYDPVEKQYKVLSVTWSKGSKEYQVLTLGIGEPSWRIIKCCRPNILLDKGVCINGVLYYICTITGVLKDSMIVCFDSSSFISRTSESFELWVLEDIDKQEWSKHTCVFPALGQNVIGDANLHFVGVTQTNEIVLASSFSVTFDLFYYNMEKKTMIRLQIQGMEDFP